MNLNKIDIELNVKIIETLKYILKDINVNISLEIHNKMDELFKVSLDGYAFMLYKSSTDLIRTKINNKYYKYVPKKVKKLSDDIIISYVNKKRYSLLVPFLGQRFKNESTKEYSYNINYNNVIIELDELTYNKLSLYIKYVYKLKQLVTLNNKLGIKQEFNIILDDDIILHDMYNSFYKYFSNIIKK